MAGGIILLLGNVSIVALGGGQNLSPSAWWFYPLMALLVVANPLVVLGFVGIQERQMERGGTVGLVGFLLAAIGVAMASALNFTFGFVLPAFFDAAPDVFPNGPPPVIFDGIMGISIVLTVGLILFGYAIFRAAVLPRWAGVVPAVGALLNFAPDPVSTLGVALAGAGVAWLCWALWSTAGTEQAEGTRAKIPA